MDLSHPKFAPTSLNGLEFRKIRSHGPWMGRVTRNNYIPSRRRESRSNIDHHYIPLFLHQAGHSTVIGFPPPKRPADIALVNSARILVNLYPPENRLPVRRPRARVPPSISLDQKKSFQLSYVDDITALPIWHSESPDMLSAVSRTKVNPRTPSSAGRSAVAAGTADNNSRRWASSKSGTGRAKVVGRRAVEVDPAGGALGGRGVARRVPAGMTDVGVGVVVAGTVVVVDDNNPT
jgi:hypothetical protein